MNDNNKTNYICRICLEENIKKIESVFNTNYATGEPVKLSDMLMAFATVQVVLGDGLPEQICFNCAQDTIKMYLFKLKCEESNKILRNRVERCSLMHIDKVEVDEDEISNKCIKSETEDYNLEELQFKIPNIELDNNNIDKHIYQFSVKEKNLYECDIGEMKFSTSGNLTRYKNTHSEDKPYECDFCQMKFSRSGILESHIRTHTGEKPYECDVCEMNFSQSGALGTHKRIHTGERPYECDICQMKFSESGNLTRHKRIHTGKKPYECDVCEMKFLRSGALTSHKRTHTGEKPYQCDICKKRFAQPGAVRSHKRTHTGEKPFECEICQLKLCESGALKRHQRRKHNIYRENPKE